MPNFGTRYDHGVVQLALALALAVLQGHRDPHEIS